MKIGLWALATLRGMQYLSTIRTCLLVAAVIALLAFVALALSGKSRTFIIEAQTTAITLDFKGENNDWFMAGTIACRLRNEPDFTHALNDQNCDARFYDIAEAADLTVQWPRDVQVTLTLTRKGNLRVKILTLGLPDFPEGTILIVPSSEWLEGGALTFSAEMTVGKSISDGERFYLTDGRWEARETGMITSLLRSNVTEVIKTGDFVRGATASVWSGNAPIQMNGHITPGGTPDRPLLELVAVSQPGNLELHVGYPGADIPTIIRPDLVDVALSSPLLLAIAVVLSVLASLSQVFADLASRRTEDGF